MRERPLFCAHCGAVTQPGHHLCPECAPALTPDYIATNTAIVESYTRRGFALLELYLMNHAAFARWLRERGET